MNAGDRKACAGLCFSNDQSHSRCGIQELRLTIFISVPFQAVCCRKDMGDGEGKREIFSTKGDPRPRFEQFQQWNEASMSLRPGVQ